MCSYSNIAEREKRRIDRVDDFFSNEFRRENTTQMSPGTRMPFRTIPSIFRR